MAHSYHERLTAADEAFLDLEGSATPMHVGAVCLYDLAPLQTSEGGLDFARLIRHIEAALPAVPRFRQRLSTIPLFGRPVWVDDEHFNLRYHVRHTAVPRPGDARQVKRLAGRILSQPLNRTRPLWEMWLIEGLDGGRFALAIKAHHCMVDGIAGADLLAALMAVEPTEGRPIARLSLAAATAPVRCRIGGRRDRPSCRPLAGRAARRSRAAGPSTPIPCAPSPTSPPAWSSWPG